MPIRLPIIALVIFLATGLCPHSAQAGFLLDWLFGGRRSEPAYPVGTPVPLGGNPGTVQGFAPGYPQTGLATVGSPGVAAPSWGAATTPSWGAATTFGSPTMPNPAWGSQVAATNPGAIGVPSTFGSTGWPSFSGSTSSAHTTAFGNYGTYFGASQPVIGPMGAGYTAPPQGGITAATLPSPATASMFQPAMQTATLPMTAMMPSTVTPAVQVPTIAPSGPAPAMPLAQTMTMVPNFNSSALRAPVTYYRPIMTTDPATGAQVVSMMPCTSYQYMNQRVPALGQTAMYGNYPSPAQPAMPRSLPAYTLPSGGIPLAQGGVMAAPSALGYGAYTGGGISQGPAISYSPATSAASGYSTTPMNASSYYGNNSGGSAGTIYSSPVPGLTAPPSPSGASPIYPAPGFSSPSDFNPAVSPPSSLPSSTMPYSQPTTPSPIYPSMPGPPSTVPSTNSPSMNLPSLPPNQVYPPSDPADTRPTLPSNGLRPQLKSIIPDSEVSSGGFNSEASYQEGQTRSRSQSDKGHNDLPNEFPVISPIPAPEGLQKPRWNPGLLREGDMTALRPVTRAEQYAGHSKKIVWASFESDSSNSLQPENRSSEWNVELQPSQAIADPSHSSATGLRNRADRDQVLYLNGSNNESGTASGPTNKYENGGWKASR